MKVSWIVALGFASFLAWASNSLALEVDLLRFDAIATPPNTPVAITHAGDERLFVTLKDGRILILKNGTLLPTPFLDIRGQVQSGGSEQGLTSTAFHPDYAANGLFYLFYTVSNDDVVIARFNVSGDPDRADAESGKVLLRFSQPFPNHNGGQLQFGPDGYLYIGAGDGGSGNDPQCNAQNGSNLLGKMLRLDIDQNLNQQPYHGIPADNPFLNDPDVRDEIWSLGLRNPWRFSFDRLAGDLYIADVGQSQREEVSQQPAASAGGENYGWKMMEGTRCTNNTGGCQFAIPGCNAPEYTPPILDYSHADGDCSITGGYVYRGAEIPDLDGVYFYGDFCTGRIWAAEQQGNAWISEEIPPRLPQLTTFGEGVDGELYAATTENIYRLRVHTPEACAPSTTSLCLNQDRFRVETTWRTPDGDTGVGQAIELTDETGYFWFFNPDNIEVVVKALNGCFDPFNHYWIFAAGLTNVEVEMTVTDTATGLSKTYSNPLNTPFQPIQDTRAFDTCP